MASSVSLNNDAKEMQKRVNSLTPEENLALKAYKPMTPEEKEQLARFLGDSDAGMEDASAILIPFGKPIEGLLGGIASKLGVSTTVLLEKLGVVSPKVTNLIGQNFGKLGTIVEKPAIKIENVNKHYVNQKITRDVSSNVVKNTIDNPKVVLEQANGYLYLTDTTAVVISKAGKLITTYGKNNFDDSIINVLKAVSK
jgi:hypothetical protein